MMLNSPKTIVEIELLGVFFFRDFFSQVLISFLFRLGV